MKHLKNILTAATLVAAASSASAIPAIQTVQFNFFHAYFSPSGGYSDAGDGSFTKLGVDFVADTTPRSFNLEVGETLSYNTFGTVTLDDGEIIKSLGAAFICNGSLLPCLTTNETDNLVVEAVFSFSSPLSGLQTVIATGTAAFGFINDEAVDFTITWADKLVNFGNMDSGQFKISMDTLEFRSDELTQEQTYSIQLITAPIPEPETYALMLAGLGLVGFMARRRKQA
jgi:hypothetical protein